MPDAVPTMMGDAAVFMLVQGAAWVRFIPLLPLSTMAVSMLGRLISSKLRLRGWGLQSEVESEETLVFYKTFKLELLRLITAVPPCQIQKSSHPLFEYCPVPDGFYLVAVSTCLDFRLGKLQISWTVGTLWPWLEQKPPLSHTFTMACCSMELRFLSLRMSSPSGVWSLPRLRPKLLDPRWGLNSCRSVLIAAYCIFVFVTSYSRTSLSLVAEDSMLSMSPLKESINSSARIAPGGGTWAQFLDVAGRTLSPPCKIP